jgi:hypothetical protein
MTSFLITSFLTSTAGPASWSRLLCLHESVLDSPHQLSGADKEPWLHGRFLLDAYVRVLALRDPATLAVRVQALNLLPSFLAAPQKEFSGAPLDSKSSQNTVPWPGLK